MSPSPATSSPSTALDRTLTLSSVLFRSSLRRVGKSPRFVSAVRSPHCQTGRKNSNSSKQLVGRGWRSAPGPAPHCCPPAQVPGLASEEGLRFFGRLQLGGAP